MNSLPYDIYDKKSIIEFAKKLENHTLNESCPGILLTKTNNKGGFGQLLEKYYFLYEPNSESEADFCEANLELKSSPIKKLKKEKYVSKERLVLNIINYMNVITENFSNSSFWKKNKNLLLIFYIYEKEKSKLDYKIEIVDEWRFPDIDLEIIKRDWEIINKKIKDGKAHELSEGDTLYLGACTKGTKGGNLREQPHNSLKAKQRAYSLKQGYVNHIIGTLTKGKKDNFGKLIPSLEMAKNTSLEDLVTSKFKKYYNQTIDEIQTKLNIKLNPTAKNFTSNVTKAILGLELNDEIEEFKKADIFVKTIRLKENNSPKEDISFPAFKFEEIVKETWENSIFKNTIEQKFLFIFFKYENDNLKLKKIKFWTMPYQDIKKVRKVWLKTKCIIKKGTIVESLTIDKKGNKKRKTNFPNKRFSEVSHVRPHAKNSEDVYPLPKTDIFTNEKNYTKQCFWLNANYIKNIYLEK